MGRRGIDWKAEELLKEVEESLKGVGLGRGSRVNYEVPEVK